MNPPRDRYRHHGDVAYRLILAKYDSRVSPIANREGHHSLDGSHSFPLKERIRARLRYSIPATYW